jgi:GTP cyclohydrolase I
MSSGSSPPLGPKPRSALPSHLLNGSSPLHPPSTSSARERESLNSSIRSSFRPAVDIEPLAEGNSHKNSGEIASSNGMNRDANKMTR